MLYEIYQYQEVLNTLEERIKKSRYKKEYLINALDISRATFYKKLKQKSFSTSELILLGKILSPEEDQALEIKKALKRSAADLKAGQTISHNEVINQAYKRLER